MVLNLTLQRLEVLTAFLRRILKIVLVGDPRLFKYGTLRVILQVGNKELTFAKFVEKRELGLP